MPVIRINDATFTALCTLKAWYGAKTPSETIDHVVHEVMEHLGIERDNDPQEVAVAVSDGSMLFDTAPGLSFTKPLKASVGGKSIPNPRWSTILLKTIAQVKAKGIDGEKLIRELALPAKTGRYDEHGFKYHPDLGISVQGQSASDAWKEVDRLAKKWHIPVTVEFQWRDNPKAQFPGKTGILYAGNA